MDAKKELIKLSKIAPLTGYIESDDIRVKEIKIQNNMSDYYLTEILTQLLENNDIREFIINYDTDDLHILSYKFR